MLDQLDMNVLRCLQPNWTKEVVLQNGGKFLDEKVRNLSNFAVQSGKIYNSYRFEDTVSQSNMTVQKSRNEISQLAEAILEISETKNLNPSEQLSFEQIKSRLGEVWMLYKRALDVCEMTQQHVPTLNAISGAGILVSVILQPFIIDLFTDARYTTLRTKWSITALVCGCAAITIMKTQESKQILMKSINDFNASWQKNVKVLQGRTQGQLG
jgi:hypothetical protein